jgi:ABC-type multidrug transport system fused ATPase/permease subunit
VFAIDNLSALGALDTIRARGLRVPDDIALAAFYDIPWFVHTDPSITAIAQRTGELGCAAVRALVDRIEGRAPRVRHPPRPSRRTPLVRRAACTGPRCAVPRTKEPVVSNPDELLCIEGIRKTFPGVVALDGVDFDLRRGEVHVLLGENGAGKSTLLKMLSGAYRPEAGRILVGGEVRIHGAQDSERLGIATISTSFPTSASPRTSSWAASRAASASSTASG